MTDEAKKPPEGQERRYATRYPVLVPGEVDTLAGPVPVEVVNLGAKGVGMCVDTPLLVGSTVQMRLLAVQAGMEPMAVLGKVMWCSEHVEVGYHAGIQITNMEPTVESRWRAWLQRLEESG